MFSFKKLTVYEKALVLAIELCKIAKEFPSSYRRIQDQLIGAVVSIVLNIAEGSGRISAKEKIHFYRISQASAFELIAVLEICDGLELINSKEWLSQIEEICKMLSGLIRSKTPSTTN